MNHQEREECIQLCWTCRDTCQKVFFHHCLEEGGEHVEQDHVKMMTDCIDICQIAADFMVRGSDHHQQICATCAEICEDCAKSCERIGGAKMQECADICRRCADKCREMGRSQRRAA